VFLLQLFPSYDLGNHRVFILFSSSKTAGALRSFGRILGMWVLIIAALIPVMGLYITLADLCPIEQLLTEKIATRQP